MSDTVKTRKAPAALIAGVTLLCLALAALAISESVGGFLLAQQKPELAAMMRPADGAALVARAQERASEALTDTEIEDARQAAQSALRGAPVASGALRALAETDQLKGDEARAQKLMDLAGQRNLRDPQIRLWLFREAVAARRYDQALLQADLLLRRHYELGPSLYPALVAELDQPGARNAFLALMRGGPNWRADFLRFQAETGDPNGIASWLLPNLASSPHPPTTTEVSTLATAFANQGRWPEVRAIWSRFAAGDSALLYNGDFDRPPREPPFGWKLSSTEGAVAAIERVEGGANRALYAQFPVGRNAVLAETLLILQPGHYRLAGRAKVEQLPPESAFQWTVTCARTPAPIATTRQDQVAAWGDFVVEFTIPPEGCDAQWLRLSGVGGEGYIPANAWYDALSVKALP